MSNKFLSFLFIGFFSLTTAQATATKTSINYDKISIQDLTQLANKGDAEAQYKLGWIYYQGQVVKQDYKEALKWYKLSAEAGHKGAKAKVGNMHYLGQGVEKKTPAKNSCTPLFK